VIPGLAERLAELRGTLAVDTSPRNVMRVAEAHWLAGRAAEATSLLEPLVDITPSAIAPRVLLGWCYEDSGRPEQGSRELAAARSLDPANPFLKLDDATQIARPESASVRETGASPSAAALSVDSSAPTPPHAAIAAEESIVLDLAAPFASAPAPASEPELAGDASPAPLETGDFPAIERAPEPPTLIEPPTRIVPPPPSGEPGLLTQTPAAQAVPPPSAPPNDPDAAERQAEPEAALTPEDLRAIPPFELMSATLGEIFERQGFDEKAIEIYREVVRRNPGREDLLARIAVLEGRAGGSPGA
jgi:hypothetical protein